MHIPDGYLSPQTTIPAIGVMLPIWTVALNKVKKVLSHKQIPLLSMCAAFSFVIMMFNVPIGGSSVHAIGAVFIAILLGPWAACVAVSVALIVQAVVFGDGGIFAIGANCFNMAVIMPFVGYGIFKLISGKSDILSKRSLIGVFLGSYFGINIAALFAAVEFGIQPMLFKAANGNPLYGYYPLSVSVPTMLFEHSIFAGPIEGIVTVGAISYIVKMAPHLMNNFNRKTMEIKKTFFEKYKAFILGLIVMTVLSPIGLIATGTAWGEWGMDELKKKIGFVPKGLEKFSDSWKALMPDYSINGIGSSFGVSSVVYILSAIVGISILASVIFITSKIVMRKNKEDERTN